jgi:hypothetical protein
MKEALKLAREIIKATNASSQFWLVPDSNLNKAFTAIEAALAQPEQEPVGALLLGGVIQTSEGFEFEEWDVEWNNKAVDALQEKLVTSEPVTLNLYTTPPQRTWVGLTEDDKVLIKHDANFNQFMTAGEYADRVQALTEARLKDKNT